MSNNLRLGLGLRFELGDLGTFGLSDLWVIGPSDYRYRIIKCQAMERLLLKYSPSLSGMSVEYLQGSV